ncbi:hypothetical protein [Streptomyces sp. SudanB182_2057]|uniref:hypothetical protein n=1 Tax=Streptomyces sp. SudanB182_2057 TaxID=3035281 RepID=UPI003F57197C
MAHYLDDGRGEILNVCRSYFRAAQALQAGLFRSWIAPPVESLDAPVPAAVTVVEADVPNLLNQLRELQMLAAPRVISAAVDLYEAIRAAADAQFELHLRSPGNGEFSRAVGRQTVSMGGTGPGQDDADGTRDSTGCPVDEVAAVGAAAAPRS